MERGVRVRLWWEHPKPKMVWPVSCVAQSARNMNLAMFKDVARLGMPQRAQLPLPHGGDVICTFDDQQLRKWIPYIRSSKSQTPQQHTKRLLSHRTSLLGRR